MNPSWYLKSLWLTISTPAYYLSLIREKVSTSLVFLAISCLWLGTLSALFFTTQVLPSIKQDILDTLDQLPAEYPVALSVRWDGLQLEISPSEKISLPFPEVSFRPDAAYPPLFMSISPTALSEEEVADQIKTSFTVVTPTDIYLKNQTSYSQLALMDIPGFENEFEVNHSNITEYVTVWKSLVEKAFTYTWLIFLAAPVVTFLSNLWVSAVNAVLIYFILRVCNIRLRYKTLFTFSVHVVVTSLVIVQLQQWLYRDWSFPLFSLCYWLLMSVIIWYVRQQAQKQFRAIGR